MTSRRPPDDDPNRMPPATTVKRWTSAVRARYPKDQRRTKHNPEGRWHVEKRLPLRRVAARWMRELATVTDRATR